MKNKNVLVTATTFPRYKNDNQPNFVKDLSKELYKNGLNVHILVPHDYGLKPDEEFDGLHVHRFIYFLPRLEKVVYGGLLPNIKKNKFLILQLPFLFLFQLVGIIRLVKKYKINSVHSHWLFPQGLSGAITKKIFNIKHILTIHGSDLFTFLKIPLGKFLIRFVIKNTDYVTCVNNEIKNKIKSLININKISVITMGVNTKEFKNKFKFNNKVLFLGRLADKKGVGYLLEAAKILKNRDIKFLIAGDGPLRKELENFVNINKLQDKVKFLGYVHGKEKIDLIKSCGIFIIPSIETRYGDQEGLPVSLLEAMAASKSIITTKVGGIKDIIRNNHNGILIKEKNPKEIINAINRLTKNKKLGEKIALNARRDILDYDWEKIGKKYYNVIKDGV